MPKYCTPVPKFIFANLVQSANAYPLTFFNVLGNVTSVILVEPLKAINPKETTFFPSIEEGIAIFSVSSSTLVHINSSISFDSFNS